MNNSNAAAGQVPIDQLPVEQLNAIKQQLEEELSQFSAAGQQLHVAQQKYADARQCLSSLTVDGTKTLVPITSSLYVAGTLDTASQSVLVDIGTGYYADMSLTSAGDYYKRKMDFVKTQLDTLQATINTKQQSRQAVTEIMQMKMAYAKQQQEQATASA